MKIKNYQEDIVIHALNVLMEDQPELKGDETFVNDVAAYVLNRMPPKYIMSERGFTRLALSHLMDNGNGEGLESLVELMALINNGIKVVKERRKPGDGGQACEEPCPAMLDPSQIEYLHNFPQFIGMVIDKSTGKYVPNACVTLFIDGVKAVSAEPGWVNPYITNSLTKGAFSFWPKAVKDAAESRGFEIKVTVEHEKYKPYTLEKPIKTKGALRVYNFIDGESIMNLESCTLMPKTA